MQVMVSGVAVVTRGHDCACCCCLQAATFSDLLHRRGTILYRISGVDGDIVSYTRRGAILHNIPPTLLRSRSRYLISGDLCFDLVRVHILRRHVRKPSEVGVLPRFFPALVDGASDSFFSRRGPLQPELHSGAYPAWNDIVSYIRRGTILYHISGVERYCIVHQACKSGPVLRIWWTVRAIACDSCAGIRHLMVF